MPVFSLAAVQFLNVLPSEEQAVYHNTELGLLLRRAGGGVGVATSVPPARTGIHSGLPGSPEMAPGVRSFHCDWLSTKPCLALDAASEEG